MKIEFKKDLIIEDLHKMSPVILMVMIEFLGYCNENNLPCKITSLINDFKGKRVSQSHAEGRAFDASVRGWLPDDIEKFQKEFNYKFKNIAAISASDHKPRLVVYHNSGYGDHLHIQVRRTN